MAAPAHDTGDTQGQRCDAFSRLADDCHGAPVGGQDLAVEAGIAYWQHPSGVFPGHQEHRDRPLPALEDQVDAGTVAHQALGSAFTLLFEQAALTLVREMPVNAAARIMEITDKRLWRVVQHYVAKAVASFALSAVQAIGLDETASKRGHNYVTVFIDMERRDKPVLFVTPGKGKETVKEFKAFLEKHDGDPEQILEVVCDMSPAFLSGVAGQLPKAQVTVDWFHIVQTFTRALDDVRKAEGRVKALPKHLRWAVLKRGDVDGLTTNQLKAMAELLDQGLDTATAWRVKERLRWVRQAPTPRAAKWRITRFINYASELVGGAHLLEPVRKALQTLRTHAERVVRRWTSTYTNARLEGLNGLFQAARARARGYRNTETFMTMIYLIASPAGKILEST